MVWSDKARKAAAMARKRKAKKKTPFKVSGTIDRVRAAEIMFGTGSKQHRAAQKLYGKSGGAKVQRVTRRK